MLAESLSLADRAATFAVVGELTLEQRWHGIALFPTRSEVWLNLLHATGSPAQVLATHNPQRCARLSLAQIT